MKKILTLPAGNPVEFRWTNRKGVKKRFLIPGSLWVTIVTMLLMALTFAYAKTLTWQIGVGVTLMLLIHELGHLYAAKKCGYLASVPIFIPYLGAAVICPQILRSRNEAYVGYYGPLFAAIASINLLLFTILWPGHHHDVALVNQASLSVNVFNMIPLRFLDGGRILAKNASPRRHHADWVRCYVILTVGQIALWVIQAFYY